VTSGEIEKGAAAASRGSEEDGWRDVKSFADLSMWETLLSEVTWDLFEDHDEVLELPFPTEGRGRL